MIFLREKKPDVFEQRKKQLEVSRLIRRLVDASAPNLTSSEERTQDRCSRCLPALLVPWEDGAIRGEVCWGITKNFSDNGVALVLPQDIEATSVVCGFWCGSPIFLSGVVRQMQPFGGCFCLAGVHLAQVISGSQVPSLLPFAKQLVPVATTDA